jgi:hypothetical protein
MIIVPPGQLLRIFDFVFSFKFSIYVQYIYVC